MNEKLLNRGNTFVVIRVLLSLTLALAGLFVFGQGIVTGSISGTTVDPQGAVVAGANVRATQVETNRVFSTTSSNAGVVQLRSLPPGRYTVVVDDKGFSSYKVENVVVEVGKDTSLGPMNFGRRQFYRNCYGRGRSAFGRGNQRPDFPDIRH